MPDQRFLAYFLSVGSMLSISLFSFCLLALLPLGQRSSKEAQKVQDYWLSVLVSFAVGALLGDAFLHLIPAAFGVHSHGDGADDHGHSHGHSHSHSHGHGGHGDKHEELLAVTVPALSIVGGMLLFFSVAKVMRSYTGHPHGHSHGAAEAAASNLSSPGEAQSAGGASSPGDPQSPQSPQSPQGPRPPKSLQPAAYLNTIADMVHNFTDGLALGISWSRSTTLGLSTSLAVLFHEIPHELGDMGILIKSGATKWQALGINSLSALCATAGAAVGVFLEHSPTFTEYVLPVTAGGFIYVAMAEMMPQLQEAPSILHSVGIAAGVFLMACVSLLE